MITRTTAIEAEHIMDMSSVLKRNAAIEAANEIIRSLRKTIPSMAGRNLLTVRGYNSLSDEHKALYDRRMKEIEVLLIKARIHHFEWQIGASDENWTEYTSTLREDVRILKEALESTGEIPKEYKKYVWYFFESFIED